MGPRVVSVVRRVLGGNHPDVDDVAQESFIALVKALPAFRGECGIKGYAARITVRTAVAAKQRQKRHREKHSEIEQPDEHAPSVSDEAAGQRRLRVLRALLVELPAGQGETLALRFMLGCSIKEIAETTDVPINTVRSRLRLAKQALRARIEADPTLAEELEIPS